VPNRDRCERHASNAIGRSRGCARRPKVDVRRLLSALRASAMRPCPAPVRLMISYWLGAADLRRAKCLGNCGTLDKPTVRPARHAFSHAVLCLLIVLWPPSVVV
jgi:hypothetical protein